MDNLNLDIEEFGLINNAHIEIGKINVVGGTNASGKSTASKLLYCFLKAMSINRKEYALNTILPTINRFINLTKYPRPYGPEGELPDIFNMESELTDIILGYDESKKIYKNLGDYYKLREIFDDWKFEIDKFIPIFLEKNEKAYSSINKYLLDTNRIGLDKYTHKNSFYRSSYSTLVKYLFSDESLLKFKGKSIFSCDSFKSFVSYKPTEDYFGMFERWLTLINEYNLSKHDFDDFDDNFIYHTEGDFKYINEVFYIDSISIFDLDYYIFTDDKIMKQYGYKEHIEYLLKQLKENDNKPELSDEVIKKIKNVNGRITDIIKGEVYRTFEDIDFLELDYYYVPENSEKIYNTHISSGIQQISIIQILLSNHKIYPGCFLILDEPEVNLHPEWQFRFAEILVLLAKELDITIYLNSHSPMFIEAMEVLTQYYDMENDTNFYLTEKSENNDSYNFVKIEYDELYRIYDNLAKPFDIIEVYRLKNEYKKGNY